MENLWHYLRSHSLSHRTYDDYDTLLAAGTDAYRKLTPEAIRSVCACSYIEHASQSGTVLKLCKDYQMFQLDPPLNRVIIGGSDWTGPTGKGVANFVEPGHRDDDILWIIDLDENGHARCVSNR